MIKLSDIRVGSEVIVRGDFGSGKPKVATVLEVEEEIKNGMSGIDYVTKDDEHRWAYLDQIDRVVKY